MELSLFLKSLGVGLAVAAPVGPMSLLCMRASLSRGWRAGLAIGGGIAVGDAIFAAIAAFGLAGLSAFMLEHDRSLHIAAGLFLIYLGVRSFFRREATEEARPITTSAAIGRDFATSVLMTLTNPPTIIMFAAVFAALAPKEGLSLAGAAITAAGVLGGSLAWWLFIVGAVTAFRGAIGSAARSWIDRGSGLVLGALGLLELNRGLSAPR